MSITTKIHSRFLDLYPECAHGKTVYFQEDEYGKDRAISYTLHMNNDPGCYLLETVTIHLKHTEYGYIRSTKLWEVLNVRS